MQMFLKPVDLTTALRPSLLPDETLLFVQDAVGLYQGYVIVLTLYSLKSCRITRERQLTEDKYSGSTRSLLIRKATPTLRHFECATWMTKSRVNTRLESI
jgi:hypothetical protein